MGSRVGTRTLWRLGALFAVWTAYGMLSGWETHYRSSFGKSHYSWFDSLRYEMSYAYLWCLATPYVTWLSGRYRLERQTWPTSLLVHLLSMSVLITVNALAWNFLLNPPFSPFRSALSWERLFRSVESSSDIGLLLYWVIVLIAHAFEYYKRYQAGLLNSSRLQTQLIRAQLDALKMQLHPHFLFNTLHTITALIQEDPDLAEKTIARLSELLRLFLASGCSQEVPLREELRILDLYLEIERTRFGDRLVTRYDIGPEAGEALVPSLILQPLVENAIRHGVGKKSGEARIVITGECVNQTLVIRVVDNGAGLPCEKKGRIVDGVGLSVTRGRLNTMYGSTHSLVLSSPPIGGVEAKVVMPLRFDESRALEEAQCHSRS